MEIYSCGTKQKFILDPLGIGGESFRPVLEHTDDQGHSESKSGNLGQIWTERNEIRFLSTQAARYK